MKKEYFIAALVAIIVIAVVFRIPQVKSVVVGS